MKIYLGSDHAGFELKEILKKYLAGLGYEVEDKGAFEYNAQDDYPDFIRLVAEAVANNLESRGVVLGGSGQGEAMVANKIKGIRAAVYYGGIGRTQRDLAGKEIDIIVSTREHNNANILSLGARFIDENEVKSIVRVWLETPFPGEERHMRRIDKIEN